MSLVKAFLVFLALFIFLMPYASGLPANSSNYYVDSYGLGVQATDASSDQWSSRAVLAISNGATSEASSGSYQANIGPLISSASYCGNSVLEAGEECDGNDFGVKSCSNYDYSQGSLSCNSCKISSSGCFNPSANGGGSSGGGSSGGGGGGGGGTCLTEWGCSDWADCVDGTQPRNCTKIVPYCYAPPNAKPDESRICINDEPQIDEVNYDDVPDVLYANNKSIGNHSAARPAQLDNSSAEVKMHEFSDIVRKNIKIIYYLIPIIFLLFLWFFLKRRKKSKIILKNPTKAFQKAKQSVLKK